MHLAAEFVALNNQNPTPGVDFNYLAHQASLFDPVDARKKRKLWDFEGSYSRSTERSDISYLIPAVLGPAQSFYRDNSHAVTALVDLNLPKRGGLSAKISAGGSVFLSSGSAPTNYYQPMAKVFVPLSKNWNWFSEWRYYGYGETFYLYEGFRTHLVTTGVRWTR